MCPKDLPDKFECIIGEQEGPVLRISSSNTNLSIIPEFSDVRNLSGD